MEKLKQIVALCKGEVILTINAHRSSYETVMEHMEEFQRMKEVDPIVLQEMIKRNTVVDLQYYPNTPIGFNNVYHYDIEKAIDIALQDLTTP